MDKIEFIHGGPEYDAKYPDGIPTRVDIEHRHLGRLSSGLVMYPEGHARNRSGVLQRLISCKFLKLASLGAGNVAALQKRFENLAGKSPADLAEIYDFEIAG